MNRLLKITTSHPWMTLLFLGIAVIAGVWSYQNVAIDAIPDIGQKQVIVLSKWMGRSPKDIEDQVTYPLSVSLLAVPGADSVRGKSLFGFSFVQVTFKDDIDIYWARSRVSELLNTVKSTLPPEVTVELGPDATALGQILYYVLHPTKPTNPADLRSTQDYVVKYALQSVEGVAEVASIGGYNREYKVDVDPKLLRFHKIGLDAISKAIKDSNDEVGANTLEQGGMEFVIRSKGFLGHDTKNRKEVLKDLENTVVLSRKGVPLRIKDLASVSNGVATRRGALDYNGAEAVGGIVIMRIGENPRSVIARVKDKMANLQKSLDGVELKIVYDRTHLVDETVATLTNALSLQVIITVIIVFIFLLNFRTSFLVGLTLPFAVILTFIGMKAIGLDANIMSLAGIAIAIGNMVDMGIVVAESIHQAFEENVDSQKSRTEIVFDSLARVAPAIMTASLTTIVSFIPVFFLTGRDYKLFAPLAWTKTFALLAAFLVSVLLIPSLYIVWRAASKRARMGEGLFGAKSYDRFSRVLSWSFQHRKLILMAPIFMFVSGVFVWQGLSPLLRPIEKLTEKAGIYLDHIPGYSAVKSTFAGIKSDDWIALDEGSLFYMPTLLPSSAFSTSLEVLQTQDALIKQIPEVQDVLGKIGRADTALDPAPAAMIETYVMLKPKREWREGSTIQSIWDEVNRLATLPGVTPASFLQPIEGRVVMLQSGIKAKMAVRIYGDSLTQLAQGAKNIASILKTAHVINPATVNPDIVLGKPYGEFVPDRFAAARYGMGIQKINQTIATAVGGTRATLTIEGRERFPVQVRYLRGERDGLEKLKTVPIVTPKGEVVPLEKLANFSTSWGPAVISSEDARLVAHVAFSPSGKVGDLETASAVEDLLAKSIAAKSLELPSGFETEIVGSFQNQIEANRRLLILIPIVLIINLFLIFLQFKDVIVSLIVFSGIPVAFGGAMLAVKIAGVEMNTAIWVGMIALFGISVDDGLIICTNIKQYVFGKTFASARDLQAAVIEATKKRFRPCFMTSTTTLIALIPVLLATGRGADVARAMGLPIVGGMLLATFELILVPSMFMLYAQRSGKFIDQNPKKDIQT